MRNAKLTCNGWTNGSAENYDACASSNANAPNRSPTSCTGWVCLNGAPGSVHLSGKGWWRLSGSPPATEGMSLAWFKSKLGLVSLVRQTQAS